MSELTNISRPPSYYVRKRLLKNKPALFGITVILIAHIIAFLGYLIMQDQTPDANDGAVQIQKMPAGFEVDILKIRRHVRVKERKITGKLLFGQESLYTLTPISDYSINEKDLTVDYAPFTKHKNRNLSRQEVDIVNATLPLYVSSNKSFSNGLKYKINKNDITYFDLDGNQQTISKEDLIALFKKENIEHRKYKLGTDKAGRDIMSRLLLGTRVSLSIGFVAVLISLFVGVIMGAIAGFFGGKIDDVIMWLMTIVWSIPGIMLVIAISLALQSKGVWVAFVAVGLTMWVEVARVVRGEIMSIKQKMYIESARALGYQSVRIIFYHILPNTLGTLIVIANANFASAILLEAGLSFLGLGVKAPTPSWGMMVNDGYHVIGSEGSWGMILFPGLAIMLLVLAFNLLGNGLRDAYDPKTSV